MVSNVVDSSGLPADAYSPLCPTRQVLGRIADKWTVLIIDSLAGGTMRYSELHRRVAGISQKMLSQTLRALERDGFLVRSVEPTTPPRVSYALTPLGESLREPLTAIREWTERHINTIERARAEYHRAAPDDGGIGRARSG